VRGQVDEQVELGRRQVGLDPVPQHPPLGLVDLEITEPQRRRPGRRDRGLGGAAQQGVHAGGQLAHRERLDHVVVGADGQTDEEVGLVVAGGEHQDRDRALGLQATADLEPVEAGQHHVEHDRVGRRAPGRLDRARAVAGDLDREPLGPQPGGDRLGDRPLVLDDQNPSFRLHRPPPAPPIQAVGGK
jgi:hypothetical protein